mmetsp:Transcript_18539/g.51557  ORF Transcript_18539/g.51557 Transcript_18539/m.51557 type:complete len:98 (-) Transcript_18539:91-384(-)
MALLIKMQIFGRMIRATAKVWLEQPITRAPSSQRLRIGDCALIEPLFTTSFYTIHDSSDDLKASEWIWCWTVQEGAADGAGQRGVSRAHVRSDTNLI